MHQRYPYCFPSEQLAGLLIFIIMFKIGQKVKRKYYDPVHGYQYTECIIVELKNNYCLVTHKNRKQKTKVPYNLLLI